MSWTVHLSPEAYKQLCGVPRDHHGTIVGAIDRMRKDPFQGNVQPLKGKRWEGRYRKVVGRYRLIFIPLHAEQIIEISQILLRTEKTYR